MDPETSFHLRQGFDGQAGMTNLHIKLFIYLASQKKLVKLISLFDYTYNEDDAEEIFECLPGFRDELSKVVEKIKKL